MARIKIPTRVVLTFLTTVPLCYYFWNDLLESLDGSTFKASLVVLLAVFCGCVDMNGLTDQPHDHDD